MDGMPYPDNCLRGITGKDMVWEEGIVSPEVFWFGNHTRENGDFVESINWCDDENAVPFTHGQARQHGTPQFVGGIAVVPRVELDNLSLKPAWQGALTYNREPLQDNPYHGNLILVSGISKRVRKAMAAAMALTVTSIIRRPAESALLSG